MKALADHPLAWTAPPPFWTPSAGTAAARQALAQPQILRFATDDFMDELLGTLREDPAALSRYAAVQETWRGSAAPPPADPAQWLERTPTRLLGVQRKGIVRRRGGNAAALATAPALKLYQPAHQRHYLVSGALVCQTAGLPDRQIDPARHRVSFVLRRLFPRVAGDTLPDPADASQWNEYAFVLQGSAGAWQHVGAADDGSERLGLAKGEERLPMFPARYTQDDGLGRRLFVGSVPVGKREAYQGAQARPDGGTLPAPMDPRVALFHKQVLGPWKGLVAGAMRNGLPGQDPDDLAALRAARLPQVCAKLGDDGYDTQHPNPAALAEERSRLQTASWLLLVDLLDFLQAQLPDFWTEHLLPSVPPTDPALRAFYDALDQARMPANLAGAGLTLASTGTPDAVSLADQSPPYASDIELGLLAALRTAAATDGLAAQLDAVESPFVLRPDHTHPDWPAFLFLFADPWFGILQPPEPAGFEPQQSDYLSERIVARIDSLADTLALALQDGPAADPTLPEAPLATRQPADMREAWYVMRLVYERPDCAPFHGTVVSAPTVPFQMAGFFDPDAPARPIRIGLPLDISPAGLRKFDKNTVFVMSDMLCGHVDRFKGMSFGDLVLSVLPFPFHKGLSVPEKGPCRQGTDPLGVMCSMSIPIITICALILLMIIVSLLDLIFRWLPYFVVCFPLPGFKGKK